jgi:hypothetical protein
MKSLPMSKYTIIIGGAFINTNSWLAIWRTIKNKKGIILWNSTNKNPKIFRGKTLNFNNEG